MAILSEKTRIPDTIDVRVLSGILDEGDGPGGWHGNDMKAAVADVTAEDAFWRPQPAPHNIAESEGGNDGTARHRRTRRRP